MKKRSQSDPSIPRPWYHEGLQFECTGCGDCCTGAPGYVWVDEEEIALLASRLGLGVDAFEEEYVRLVGRRKSLLEFPNGDCVFFDNVDRRCSVYDSRPRQCRTWPFWESNLKTRRTWAETCRSCPGCGHGPLIPVEEIVAQATIVRV
ncbi:MAG: YkgJ family cysteine cluster protein [Pirellulales bacterium]|nr:YkgJ family cysteine cluster protein [Pirellulales bacterium]